MNTRLGDVVLPNHAEALDRISQFNELETDDLSDYVALAHALRGMSVAYSSLAQEYGAKHPPEHTESNIGLWTTIGEADDKHKFTVTTQDSFGLNGAHLSRSAIDGGPTRYYDDAHVPTERVLDEFLATEPSELRQGWDKPSWTDIYATRARTEDGRYLFHHYWPFNQPLAKRTTGPSPQESLTTYTRILQELSRTMLEVVRRDS